MALPVLNFPRIDVRFKKNATLTLQLFDIVRKKFISITPEEWVRQHIIHYLIHQKLVPVSLISVEKQLILNGTKRRTDIVVFNTNLQPILIVECKAFEISINQETINQAMRYNLVLKVPYVFLSNGFNHCILNLNNSDAIILKELPLFEDMCKNMIFT